VAKNFLIAASHTRGTMKRLTKELRRDIAALAAKKDSDIDFSDMPEVLDWTGAEIGRFYRPMENRSKQGTRGIQAKKRPPRKAAAT
jgi:hypothetical protein